MAKRPTDTQPTAWPLSTVIVIIIFLVSSGIGFTGTMMKATEQWDATQEKIGKQTETIAELKVLVVDLKASLAATDYDHSRQFAQLTVRANDLAHALDSLSSDEEQHKQSDSDTAASIRAGMQNLLNDIAVIKCHIPGNQCTVKQK